MAYPSTLVVLTLLQLCRAEISDTLPESWYSANVISDSFQPKPLSEIFSTETTFSTANPIIVVPKTSAEDVGISTLATSTKLSSTTTTPGGYTKISIAPLVVSTPLPPVQTQKTTSQYQPQIPLNSQATVEYEPQTQFIELKPLPQIPQFQSLPDFKKPLLPPQVPQTQPLAEIIKPQIFLQPPPETEFGIVTQSEPQTTQTIMVPQQQTTQTLPRNTQNQSQQIRFEWVPPKQRRPNLQRPPQPALPQTVLRPSNLPPNTNYFLIYQQAPQSIQGFPLQAQEAPRGLIPQTSTTLQQILPTTPPQPRTVVQQILTSQGPVIYETVPSTRSPTTNPPTLSTTPEARPVVNNTSTTRIPPTLSTLIPRPLPPSPVSGIFPLKIRVVAPSGSITNVRINPNTESPTTTKRTTTTRRPTTTRTRKTPKPKKNSYNMCTNACRGRDPICAAPLGSTPIDETTLKGFPSICHMACHNSFRKDAYEKLIDGRCSRIRTRIRTVDSNSKLKKDELNKAQYFVDSAGPTVVEFTGAIH